MANIQISEINLVGYDLLHDSESFLNELATEDMINVVGGHYHHRSHSGSYGGSHSGSYASHSGSYGGGYYSRHSHRGYWY
jgi:hypothetical protein